MEGDARELPIVEKYTLLLLYAAGGRVRGKLWFHKEMFELSQAFSDLAEELDFNAYSYGPFSEALEEHRDMLENSGLLDGLSLTDRGLKLAEELWRREPSRGKEVVKATASFLEGLDRDELLLYTYVTHPETAGKSDARERIMRRRREIALKMLEEGKISLSLAAKLAGLPVEEVIEVAIKRGIKPFDVQGDLRE
jgi:predicted HTH domain antitoxin